MLPLPPGLTGDGAIAARDLLFLAFLGCIAQTIELGGDRARVDNVVASCRDFLIEHTPKHARDATLATYRASVLRRFVRIWSQTIRTIALGSFAAGARGKKSDEEIVQHAANTLATWAPFAEQTASLKDGDEGMKLMLIVPGRLAVLFYKVEFRESGLELKEWFHGVEAFLDSGASETV